MCLDVCTHAARMRTLIFKGFFFLSAVGCFIVAVEKIGAIRIPGDFDGICFISGMIFKFLNSWCSKILYINALE